MSGMTAPDSVRDLTASSTIVCGHSLGVALGVVVDGIWFSGQGHKVLTGW
jgi:hypothetical protein